MANGFTVFEAIVRKTSGFVYAEEPRLPSEHPFDPRNIHPCLPQVVRRLFDDGHYAQATFEAFKFVDKEVARISGVSESGYKLMMSAFAEASPLLKLTPCSTVSEKDEQKGYQFLFAGSMMGIRNPRGHEYSIHDSPDECLDHLSLASLLLRRVEAAGFKLSGA